MVLLLTTDAQGCSDRNAQCPQWAANGECYKNRGYMHVNCAQSCHQCIVQDEACKDLNEQCAAWATNGECERNYPYMRKTCARACTFCQPANDHSVPHIHANFVDEYWEHYMRLHPELGNTIHG
ncbi:putative tyrosinase-like protein tyr-3 [Procambarus clarkii]|uniref:putative tyrosinase-like protein tyr-3 n=1 Tax=Procambarus clarkii TaxID=6728 RepID=UPI00374221F1